LPQEIWSIGVYKLSHDGEDLKMSSFEDVHNPVLTAKDITDRDAEFVADPFLLYEEGLFYMFFEIKGSIHGDIGLAISKNGADWQYKGVVLDEPFHLSYPCVFRWQDDYYVVPESHIDKSIRLYKAKDFPYLWKLYRVIVKDKDLVEPTIFYYDGIWWMFANPSQRELFLYYSKNLEGPWVQHPQRPLVSRDINTTRLGGNVYHIGNRLIRTAQDCYPVYGNAIRLFEITKLTFSEYEESELKESPVLKASGSGWNSQGMHQLSCVAIGGGERLCVVDGKKHATPAYFCLGKFLKIKMPDVIYKVYEALRNL